MKRKGIEMMQIPMTAALSLPVLVWSAPAWAQPPGERDWMWHPAWGWGHMMFGGLMMIVFWGGLIVLAILLIRWLVGSDGIPRSRSTALQILQERFARGEIDKEEYEERRRILLG